MKICPNCLKTYSENEKYCIHCGEKIIEPNICVCGHINRRDSKFCTKCGNWLNTELPEVETGSWLKVSAVFFGAFIVLFIISLFI